MCLRGIHNVVSYPIHIHILCIIGIHIILLIQILPIVGIHIILLFFIQSIYSVSLASI